MSVSTDKGLLFIVQLNKRANIRYKNIEVKTLLGFGKQTNILE